MGVDLIHISIVVGALEVIAGIVYRDIIRGKTQSVLILKRESGREGEIWDEVGELEEHYYIPI